MKTTVATQDELSKVNHYITKAYPHGESCVTGMPIAEDDEQITVRLYSAGCLHGPYTITRSKIVKVTPWAL